MIFFNFYHVLDLHCQTGHSFQCTWIGSHHRETLLFAHRHLPQTALFKKEQVSWTLTNAPLTMNANGVDIFCRLHYQSGRCHFPSLAKDRSVVPLVRSSDPLFSEPELHYKLLMWLLDARNMQLSAVWFGRSLCAVIRIGGSRLAAAGSLYFCSQVGRYHSC